MIDDVVVGFVEARGEPLFRDRHADGVAEALTEGAGGHFDARCVAALGMAGRHAVPLAKALQFRERQRVAREVKQAVEQHGAVAGGEHEAVAIGPVRVRGIELHVLHPERVSHGRSAHGHTGVARIRLLDGICREDPDGVDAQVFKGLRVEFRQAILLISILAVRN